MHHINPKTNALRDAKANNPHAIFHLLNAIERNESERALQIVMQDPNIIFTRFQNEGNILHLLVKRNRISLLETLLTFLETDHPNKLNMAARQPALPGESKYIVLPIQHLNKKSSSHKKIYQRMLGHLIQNPLNIKPTTDEKNPSQEIKTNLAEHEDPDLSRNLAIGFDILNRIKSYEMRVSTHPDANNSDIDFKKEVVSIYQMASEFIESHGLESNEAIIYLAEYFIENKLANCEMLAYIALYEFMKILAEKKFPHSETAEIIFMRRPGDHAFIVIGRDPESDINNFATWGKKAVVVDAWSDKAFSANKIPVELFDYMFISDAEDEKRYNVLVSYHPDIQKFESFFQYQYSPITESVDENLPPAKRQKKCL